MTKNYINKGYTTTTWSFWN